jgi:hypothetical protein
MLYASALSSPLPVPTLLPTACMAVFELVPVGSESVKIGIAMAMFFVVAVMTSPLCVLGGQIEGCSVRRCHCFRERHYF